MGVTNEKDLEALEEAISRFMRTGSRHRTWERIAAQAGVTMDRTGAIILKLLAAQKTGGCRLQEIAQQLGIEAPSVTRKVQQLEQLGLVKRRLDSRDGRARTLILTKDGHTVVRRLHKARRMHFAGVLADWSSQDCRSLATLLARFAEDLEAQELRSEVIIK